MEHTVAPKESFYSIGRLYNVPPKELASYNHLPLENGLSVGYDLKIPLDKNNFSQTKKATNGEAHVPLFHTVGPNETLYRLGVNYNKVPLASLKKWNHLQSDAVSVGSSMIVGYLKVDKNQSALASQPAKPVVDIASAPEKPTEKTPEVALTTSVTQDPEPVKTEKKETGVPAADEQK